MATLRTMNRRRRRKIEPGIVVEVFTFQGDRMCSHYERYQGRHVRWMTPRGEPRMVCSKAPEITQAEVDEMIAAIEKIADGA